MKGSARSCKVVGGHREILICFPGSDPRGLRGLTRRSNRGKALNDMRMFFDLTKGGIVSFVLVTGAAGYAMSMDLEAPVSVAHFVTSLAALFFLSAGSFALNQAQEVSIDRKMPRTQRRPIPAGRVSVIQAWVLGIGFVVLGALASALINMTVLALGLATVFLYNVTYTMWWKRKWAFGAVPGAIPGAMPVLIGYAANNENIWAAEPMYLFLIMFLWQMPHFWSLAIRFRDDYERGGIPVLPAVLGTERTLYHMALYLLAYVATAAMAPWFTSARWAHLVLVWPLAFWVFYQFVLFYKSVVEKHERTRWLPFFLWTNLSVLVFLAAPVVDRWTMHWIALATWGGE